MTDTTTGGNLKVALDFRSRVTAMIDDPDLKGDALLLTLAVLDMVYEAKEHRRRERKKHWLEVIRDRTGLRDYSIRRAFADDIPRYEVPEADGTCTAPMIRREGLCGKSSYARWIDRDPETGEGTWVALCTRHRTHEAEYQNRQRIKAWMDNGRPEPPANTGGIMRRYFHCDWDHLYQWADRTRWERSQGKDAPPPSIPKPRLTVIQGGRT